MDYVNLGRTGLRVSRICLGMMSYGRHETRPWALPEDEAEPIVRHAAENGVTFFDTADVYNGGESEVITGRLLPKLFGMREEYVLATKVFMPTMPGENGHGLSRKHILASIDASLQRLGHDYVDLYQIHRFDPTTPVEETMGALHDVVQAGKARYIGASSMFAWQFAKAQRVAATPFVSMQNHYNLIYREEEREVIPQCLDQVALAWLLHRPGVTAPIVGATKLAHLQDAIAASALSLSAEELARLEEPYVPHAIAGHV